MENSKGHPPWPGTPPDPALGWATLACQADLTIHERTQNDAKC